MTKRNIEPFTQEVLRQVYEVNGIVTLDGIAERLNGWNYDEIVKRLNMWRYRGVISYTLADGDIQDFVFLKDKPKEQAEMTEGRRLKMDLYYRQAMAMQEIIDKSTASDTNRINAVKYQQQAMNEVPDDVFKELSEVYQ